MNNNPNVKCPICDKPNTWHEDNQFRPFCSDRCKLIDLGEWANETRKIPSHTIAQDLSVAVYNNDDLE